MSVLSVEHISKSYRTVRALRDVTFRVPRGSVFGILGPNGSGKTTLLGIVTGVLNADAGSFTMFGDTLTPAHELRKRTGTLLETPNFYHYLSAYDNLVITSEIKGKGRDGIDEILRKVGLHERRDSKFSTFSLGMKQRLGIAAALLGDAELLILDEPTNGLDPEGIAEIRSLIKELGAAGHTIVMASHLLDEVEKVCTHVAILKKGELLAAGSADEIMTEGDIVELSAADTDSLYDLLCRHFPGQKLTRDGETVRLYFPGGGTDTAALNELCHSQGIVLTRLLLRRQSLESMFLELVSNPTNGR
ncbi:MAG: ABC transporter ATP-binding protein [Rikenellaceae bacterium]|nr:ABC transporter ATP-binding protein [Rikenellaceae bacterium]